VSDPRKDPYREGEAAASARRLRSLAIAGSLALLVVLVFVVSVLKMAGNMHHG
jgi:hypothetical protein